MPPTRRKRSRLGRYLVEGPGHCGECHTPRDFAGGTKKDEWLAGAAAAEGDGIVPNITSGEGGIGDWSEGDIANYLETGFTPDFDSVGGAMVDVQKNMAQLQRRRPRGDRRLSQGGAAASQRLSGDGQAGGRRLASLGPYGEVQRSPRNSKPSSKKTL